jgi:DNA repair protein SbcC/Rad50
MRLHTLEVTAFGPFAETVTVDFDALSEASVFLLCGDTGAGKTTVLDAVCFAFYGDVPSERSAAKQLRSHHAADGVAPRVVLEASLSGRRFRFTRSPQWQRRKKRGTGLTTQQAHVLVEEAVVTDDDTGWRSLTTRLDEAGHLVTDLLGMTLGQFSQVVLLPQGQFDTFLRASSDDRHKVLTQLFRTRRFEDVERWLCDRRATLRRAGERHHDTVAGLLHRVSEATGAELPSDWDVADLSAPAHDGDIETWTAELAKRADDDVTVAATTLDATARGLASATDALDAGRVLRELRQRHAAALAAHRALADTAEEAETDRRRLSRARRAAVVAPLARVAAHAESCRERARYDASQALRQAAALLEVEPEGLDPVELADRARHATERAAVARSFLPRARELADTTAALADLEQRRRHLAAEHDRVRHVAAALPGRKAALTVQVETQRAQAARLPESKAELADLARRVAFVATVEELEWQARDAEERLDQRRRETMLLKEQLIDLREARLSGMAAELAAAVAVGEDCPVCGSHEHPRLASPATGAPTRTDEQTLRRRVDDAEVAQELVADQVRGFRARLEPAREAAGEGTPEQVQAACDAARVRVAAAEASAASVARLEPQLAALDAEARALDEELVRLRADLRVADEQRAAAGSTVAALTAQLTDLLDGRDASLDEVIRHHERAATALARARDALLEQERADTHAVEAASAASAAAVEQGFSDDADALAAILDDEAVATVEAGLRARDVAAAEADAVLRDDAVRDAVAAAAPDLPALGAAYDEATEARAAARVAHEAAVVRRNGLSARSAALREALAAWAPVHADHVLVRSLSEFAEGKGSDNPRQMRLSAYVLAARLGQVVAAANERMSRMTDDRYVLEHTAQRGVGERRGGLSLLVRDQWTDERRDPVTLSGGETFVVSLALALGLADVVTGEAGGARIETLFVDEGFGSLDSDTLELVMDTLDQLREGGRVVGVVSHVPELRTRIPTQLVVHKTRAGSSVEQRLGDG